MLLHVFNLVDRSLLPKKLESKGVATPLDLYGALRGIHSCERAFSRSGSLDTLEEGSEHRQLLTTAAVEQLASACDLVLS